MFFRTNNPAIYTVPAASNTRWNVGKSLDAGTLQILQNNLASFQSQHCRTLATQNGGLSNVFFNGTSEATKRGFGQSSYATPSNFSTSPTHKQLAWGSDVAMKFGPFYLPKQVSVSDGVKFLPINVTINISGSAGSNVYVAINGGENPFSAEPYAIQKVTFGAGVGYYNFSFSGISDKPATEDNTIWMNSDTNFLDDRLTPLYAWVGVYRPNTGSNFMSITVSDPRLQI